MTSSYHGPPPASEPHGPAMSVWNAWIDEIFFHEMSARAASVENAAPRVVGRYLVYGEIAAGGMATVHFGRLSGAVGFARTVAIKRLHPQFAKDPEFVSMFLDEARLAGRIRHPNVVPMLDVVAMPDEVFLVMEYVQGESLSKLVRLASSRGQKIPLPILGAIMTNLLAGLHAAHETRDEHGRPLGIVHRDVSPQNVLVGTDGSARVLDFGVAKAAGRTHTTREGQIKGKLSYMAPEQLSGGTVTRKTDLYAAGVVLWECLAGRKLYEGDNEAQVLMKVLAGAVPSLCEMREDVPAVADMIVCRALASDPSTRYENAKEMAADVERVFGLASPSVLGEWVEQVAADELARRAEVIGHVEASSATMPIIDDLAVVSRVTSAARGAPASAVRRVTPEEPTSQVSSISVSRAASELSRPSMLPGSKRTWLVGSLLAICVVAGGFVGYAFTAPEPGTMPSGRRLTLAHGANAAHVMRAYLPSPSVVSTVMTSGGGNPASPVNGAAGANTGTPGAQASSTPAAITKPRATDCNPPYRIDPTTGRKQYKMECLQ